MLNSCDNETIITNSGRMFKPAEDPFEDPVEVTKKSIWGHMTDDDKFNEMYCYGEGDK